MRAALAIGACVLACASSAAAAGVSFVRATSQYRPGEDHRRYNPLNLLDDDPDTIWCAAASEDPADQGVEIVFKKPQHFDRLVVTPTAKSGRVVSAVRISDGTRTVTVHLGATPAAEVLRRPLDGTTFTVTIAALGDRSPGAAVPEDVACLADTLLYAHDSLFGGGSRVRYDAKLERLVGDWNGGPLGAPEKTLVFSLDGTWDWTYTPLLGGKSKRTSGEYRFKGDRLLMREGEVGRWVDMRYRYRRVKVDPSEMGAPVGDYDLLVLDAGLGGDVGGEYTNARFQ